MIKLGEDWVKVFSAKLAEKFLSRSNPDKENKPTTYLDIEDKTGIDQGTIAAWVYAAESAINLEEASKEIKESTRKFFIKCV